MLKPSKEESYRIAHNIKKMRELKGYNQRHIADQLGISQNSYSRIETGETTPDDERLEKIAALLTTTVKAIKGKEVEKIVFHIQHQEGHSGNVSVYNAVGTEIQKAIEHSIKPLKKELSQLKEESVKMKTEINVLKKMIGDKP